jgi:origin recognition complex subunit 1
MLTGMVRINFQPYTTPQLEQIVHARLGGKSEVLSGDAVKFAAMKVSSISGDARRVLDICRCVFPSLRLLLITAKEQAGGL